MYCIRIILKSVRGEIMGGGGGGSGQGIISLHSRLVTQALIGQPLKGEERIRSPVIHCKVFGG